MQQIIKISEFIFNSFLHIWPYLLITIPLAVAVNLSGVSKIINKIFSKNPFVSILLATAIGAFSPFCSCGVIPVVASLLIGGMPLAPVMSFWIASPSMDVEIFMLSVASLGWKMSIWRLVATFIISLSAGFITWFAVRNNLLGTQILRSRPIVRTYSLRKKLLEYLRVWINQIFTAKSLFMQKNFYVTAVYKRASTGTDVNCCITVDQKSPSFKLLQKTKETRCSCDSSTEEKKAGLKHKIFIESWKAFSMVAKFMFLAFLINAIIRFYVPEDSVIGLIGGNNPFSVLLASLIGIPFYTNNITALPLINGLLTLGMNKGAALAFLIAGPTTTLPAMMAVWGIVKPKVFLLYISFSLCSAIILGYLYNFFA